ncbi:MAG: S1 RNA-binding domain-containing protein [Thermoplasmatales archaeon]|nr:MAG: S1 RNA-binding domain-containing protein [Thermoplasmatales archaeon]
MSKETREIVIPSQLLGDIKDKKAGRGTFIEKGKIYAEVLGVLNINPEYINVVPLKGRYDPIQNDFVIGIIIEAMSSSWLVDINAAYPALLHVNEVPWDVDFGETEKYLNMGDTVMAKVLSVDQEKKLQITLKDRNLYKVKGGLIIDAEPSKVPRIIGKKASMISLIKKYTNSRIFVGQNGRIWIDGEPNRVKKVIDIINMIEQESLSYGLTNKIEDLLKKYTKDVH